MTKLYLLIVFLCVVACSFVASAQGPCTREMMTGTYVFQATGASTILTGTSPMPGDVLHWTALHAPFAITGLMAFQPNGDMQGYYWSVMGRVNNGLTKVPFNGRVSEFDGGSCMAILEFRIPVSATATFLVKDVLFIRDGGKEMVSLGWEPPVETLTWTGSAKLISRSFPPARICNQGMTQGRYLLRCQGLQTLDPAAPAVSSAAVYKMEVSGTGAYSAWLYGRMGIPFVMPIVGTLQVNDDCSAEMTGESVVMPGVRSLGRGIVFAEGKEGVFQPLVVGLPPPLPDQPQPYGVCQLLRVER